MTWSPSRLIVAMGLLAIPGLGLGACPAVSAERPADRRSSWRLGFATLPYFWLRQKRSKRLDKLEEQFPEALDFLARSMRAGHAFTISLEMLGEELADPLGQEFRTLFNEQNLGAPLEIALRNFTDRVPLLDVALFHLLGAAAEADRRQPERNSVAAGVRHPRAFPAEGTSQSGLARTAG